jgi:hypothetical protein
MTRRTRSARTATVSPPDLRRARLWGQPAPHGSPPPTRPPGSGHPDGVPGFPRWTATAPHSVRRRTTSRTSRSRAGGGTLWWGAGRARRAGIPVGRRSGGARPQGAAPKRLPQPRRQPPPRRRPPPHRRPHPRRRPQPRPQPQPRRPPRRRRLRRRRRGPRKPSAGSRSLRDISGAPDGRADRGRRRRPRHGREPASPFHPPGRPSPGPRVPSSTLGCLAPQPHRSVVHGRHVRSSLCGPLGRSVRSYGPRAESRPRGPPVAHASPRPSFHSKCLNRGRYTLHSNPNNAENNRLMHLKSRFYTATFIINTSVGYSKEGRA